MDVSNWKDFSPLAGVITGWFLNQWGQWFVVRRDERKAVGRALADLLEIRHRLLAIPKVVEMMGTRLPIPADAHAPLRLALGTLFPADEGLTKRFEESVNFVAATNPLLGFRLRSQDMIAPLLHRLRATALQGGKDSVAVFSKIEDHLIHQMSPHLDKLILELAWRYGLRSWWATRRLLNRPWEMTEDFWEGILTLVPQQEAVAEDSQPKPAGTSSGPSHR